MNSCAATVGPGYRHFLHTEAEFRGQEKDFGIESPALDFLQRENLLHRPLLKSLEAALRILEVQTERDPQQQVENASEDLAMERLPLRLQFGLQPARSDGDVGAVTQRLKKFGKLLDRRRQVGVAENDHPATRLQHAMAHAVTFAAVAGVFDQPQCGIAFCETAHDFSGIVDGAVVDNNYFDLGGPFLLRDVTEDFPERRTQAGALVVSGNDDAVGGVQSSFWFPVSGCQLSLSAG